MEAAVTLIETLTKEAISLNKKVRAVKSHIGSLRSEIVSFKANLEIWTKKPITDERLKALVKQYREAVYEAEDVVDDYVVEKAKYESKNVIRKFFSFNHPGKLLEVAEKIHRIIEDSRKIGENWNQVEALQGGDQASYRDKKLEKVPEVGNNVVGLKDEQERIIKHLTEGSNELEVISIVGMSGLGKTTLAKRILTSPEIEGAFEKRISVSVTENFSLQEVFLSILKQFSKVNDKIRSMSPEDLAKEIEIYSTRENYLILMDDVHTKDDWSNLITAFPGNKMKSRILLTTRYNDVARHARSNKKEPITLRFLDNDESWELLKGKAFRLEECPSNLEKHGKEIAKQCGGLPLKIVLMGGILFEKDRNSHVWEAVSRDVGRYIVTDKTGVDLSYYELPYPLKACFVYFGMFPKGCRVSVKKLISLWIAEGFIQKDGTTCLEEIAEEYLCDLVNKSLVLIEKRSSNGRMKTCYVHDVVHEFCKSKAEEENLYQVIGKNYQRTHASDNFDLHRVCIHHSDLGSGDFGPRVRSFLCSFPETITTDTINYPFKNNKLLRVFDGEPITFPHFPQDIARLVHLRFLILHTDAKIVPECISYLWNLQTLRIHSSPGDNLKIKGDTGKMTQLRHVKTNASTSWNALSERKKEKKVPSRYYSLSTLSMVSPETCTKDAFERAPNLERLGIRGQLTKLFEVNNHGHSLFDNLIGLEALESLKLVNHPQRKIVSLPKKFPLKLRKLTLVNTHIDWKHMSTLGMLEKLVILKLKNNAFEGSKWEMKEEYFIDLEVLHIEETNLVVWKASDWNFPSLRCLYLRHCIHLVELPLSLASIPSLETVDLRQIKTLAVDSAKKIEQQKMHNHQTKGGKAFKLTIDSAI